VAGQIKAVVLVDLDHSIVVETAQEPILLAYEKLKRAVEKDAIIRNEGEVPLPLPSPTA
jgi:hypothetical protein